MIHWRQHHEPIHHTHPSHDSRKLYFTWGIPDAPLIHWRRTQAASVTEAALEWATWADEALPDVFDSPLLVYVFAGDILEDLEKHGNTRPTVCLLEKQEGQWVALVTYAKDAEGKVTVDGVTYKDAQRWVQ